jgi:hypothetical protein
MEKFNKFITRKDEVLGQQQPGQIGPDIQQFGQAQSGLMRAASQIQNPQLKGELMNVAQTMNRQVIALFQKHGMMGQ